MSAKTLLLSIGIVVGGLPRRSTAQDSARGFHAALDSIYDAIARGDSAALGRRLESDLVWVVGATGAEVSRSALLAAASGVQDPPVRFDTDSVQVRRVGGVALVRSRRVDHRFLGGVDFPASWRVLDVFSRSSGEWKLVHHVQTWLVAPVIPRMLDSAAQQAFVGKYAVAPGITDDVHWQNGHLVATITGHPPGALLVPVSTNVFSPDGVGALIAFERDTTGRVIGYVQGYPDGRIDRRRRLP